MHELDQQVVELGPTVLGERFPTLRTDDVAVAGMSTGAGFVDTGRYTAWLADRARAEGVTIREETPVDLSTDPPGVVPRSGPGAGIVQETGTLVVAAGARSKHLLADVDLLMPMKPYRVQALVGEIPSAVERRTRSSEDGDSTVLGPMWYDASADCYARPHREGLLAGDGTEPVEVDPEKYDRDANPGFAGDLAASVAHRLPDCALAGNRPASRRRATRRRGHPGVRPEPV